MFSYLTWPVDMFQCRLKAGRPGDETILVLSLRPGSRSETETNCRRKRQAAEPYKLENCSPPSQLSSKE